MLTNGFVKVWRSILDHPIITQLPPTVLKVWIICLIRANWQPTKWYDGQRQVDIPAGAFIFSQETFAKMCHVSRDQLRTALRHLQNLECITIRTTSRYSLLIIEKWSIYQLADGTLPQRGPQQIPSASPADPQHVPTEEEVKKLRSEENTQGVVCILPTRASDLDAPTSGRFEEFWGKYPRKQRKDFACSQFVGLVTAKTEGAVFSCLDRYLASDEVARGIVMNPDKWLYEQHRNGWEGDWPRRASKDLSDKMLDTMTRNLRNYGRLT